MPCISVIMPLYNKDLYVERAVRSALSQSFEDFELIVVNDGSTDKGPEKVMTIKDERIKIIEQPNAGVSAARNRGIREARAELIAFLDADDEWEKDYLESVVNLRKKFPGCDVFTTSYWFSSPAGHRRRAIIRNFPKSPWEGILNNYFTIAAKSDPPLWTSAVVVTKQAINAIGGFPAGIISGEDLLTWAKLAVNYKIAFTNRPCGIHWNPEKASDRPGRVPQFPDIVGRELLRLSRETGSSKVKGLEDYIALWHRMRGITFMQIGNRDNALYELREALKYAPTLKLYLLAVLTLMPLKLSMRILMVLKRIKKACF